MFSSHLPNPRRDPALCRLDTCFVGQLTFDKSLIATAAAVKIGIRVLMEVLLGDLIEQIQ